VEALAHCRSKGGRVVGRYRHVLIVEAGPRWLAVQDGAAACSPFSLVLTQAPPSWPDDGTPACATSRLLRIGELTVRLPGDEAWPVLAESAVGPVLSEPDAIATVWRHPDAVADVTVRCAALGRVRAEEGYRWAEACLAPYVAASAFGTEARTGVARMVRERGAAALAILACAVSQPALEAAADRLCGLGGGATPSGDDALIGFLGAWLRLAPVGERGPARRLAAWLAAAAPERTSRLAAEFYYHLARERLSEPVEHVLSALASGRPEAVENAAGQLAGFGASSGRDTLAGVDAYLRRPSTP
jgi:hypothetical protein